MRRRPVVGLLLVGLIEMAAWIAVAGLLLVGLIEMAAWIAVAGGSVQTNEHRLRTDPATLALPPAEPPIPTEGVLPRQRANLSDPPLTIGP